MRYATLLFTGILFAKSGLPLGAIGNYETLLFIAAIVCTFWVTGIIKSMLSLYDDKTEEHTQTSFFFNVFLLITILSVLCFLFLRVLEKQFAHHLSDYGYIPYFNLISWYVLLVNPTALTEYVLFLKNKTRLIYSYGLLIHSIQLIAVSLPVVLGYPLGYSIWGLLIVCVIRWLFLFCFIKQHSLFKVDLSFLIKHFQIALPLILSNLIASSADLIDGFIVSSKFTDETFAIFRYGAREFPLTLLLATTLGNAMITEVANSENLGNVLKAIKQKSLLLIYILFPITILLILFSPYLYPIVFNVHFSESALVFNAYLLLVTSRLVFPQSILTGLKQNHYLLWVSVIELIINFIASLILVNYMGINGVALGTVIAFSFEKLILMMVLKIKFNIHPSSYIPIKTIVGFTILLLLVFMGVQLHFNN